MYNLLSTDRVNSLIIIVNDAFAGWKSFAAWCASGVIWQAGERYFPFIGDLDAVNERSKEMSHAETGPRFSEGALSHRTGKHAAKMRGRVECCVTSAWAVICDLGVASPNVVPIVRVPNLLTS